ncbi:hypothetical protein BC834DRAFT_835341 [Gloeopeniophorella convolvens]|nr:hypothetical protein BC834DRAFT_835341 [Gloeopeniophorella convolvens]
MKDLVGDAVGNMSISPSYRDLVLAARNGLFIIDLKAPFDVPRFLPQGGTWDVADVQWNPHPARSEYIISTSSEKLLIWNLRLAGKTAIEHALHSHYRAITDINWHTKDPDIVVSTGIDSWLWAWDLRTPQKPIMGLCAFNAGGTQVKWNRQDGNVLASSHLNEVLIWDRRKGSIPVKIINAHAAKIYGIDWAHNSPRELVTCSLDKTIKTWDVDSPSTALEDLHRRHDSVGLLPEESIYEPRSTIHTSYPVWRARDLPFGNGLLSLPQRGGDALEMWAHSRDTAHTSAPVESFEGHSDVVKEFVWRRGGREWGEFQLITWSKDKTLRFWPVDRDAMQRAGQPLDKDIAPRAQGYGDNTFSFRTPPEAIHVKPALSAPVGQRGILAEVRAAPFGGRPPHPVRLPLGGSRGASQPQQLPELEPEQTPTTVAISAPLRQGGTMTRGNRSARMDALTWLSSVRVGERTREGSSGTGSGADSGNVSRIGSRSRPASRDAGSTRMSGVLRKRSDSRGHWDDESEGQSLQDELTSVVTKLQQESSRIKLEKHDLGKKRTCTLGLNGPWGDSSSVFVRVTFTFPKDYPHASHPGGTPTVDLERSPLISIRSRAFMLRRLRVLRENRRPCLEACLRFLLYGNEDDKQRRAAHIDYDSSSDEDRVSLLRSESATVAPLHSDKNIAEPVTSQGVFGPNGKSYLVCFSRAPPRIVRNPLHELASSPSGPSRSADSIPRLFQSPGLISDAVRRLTLASHDPRVPGTESRRGEDSDNILHIMTNLLLFSRLKQRRPSEQSRPLDDIPANYSVLPTHAVTVFIRDAAHIVDPGQDIAQEYIFDSFTPSDLCTKNAAVARKRFRRDHEHFFTTLGLLLSSFDERSPGAWYTNSLVTGFIRQMCEGFSQDKDIQMLAMLSVVLLKVRNHLTVQAGSSPGYITPRPPIGRQLSSNEYFTFRLWKDRRGQPRSPSWAHPASSPVANFASTSLSSMSSRGSWSSLFNAGNVRQLIGGSYDTSKDSVHGDSSSYEADLGGIPVPESQSRRSGDHDFPRAMPHKPDSPHRVSPAIRHLSESSSTRNAGSVHSVATGRRPTFSQVARAKQSVVRRSVRVVDLGDELQQQFEHEDGLDPSPPVNQLVMHVVAYAEMLFRWGLVYKRIELLKAVGSFLALPTGLTSDDHDQLGVSVLCSRCGQPAPSGHPIACATCSTRLGLPQCTICRLPVKGLSFNCLECLHVSHLSCWKFRPGVACATGCSCRCRTTNYRG